MLITQSKDISEILIACHIFGAPKYIDAYGTKSTKQNCLSLW
jgi:hypothetical protein